MITQEALLSYIHNYGKVTSHPVTACHAAQQQYPSNMLHAALDKTTGHLMEMWCFLVNPKYKDLWGKSYTKELGCLAQGMLGVSKGTNTIVFIHRKDIPHDPQCNVMYAQVCVNYCPEKENSNRTQVTMGGNLLHYPGDCGTPTIDIITVKLHLSSVISTKNACYSTIDLKDFYLNTPMDQPEYMHMKISDLPPYFVRAYNLIHLATGDGTISVKIQKGVYGLLQAGILAQNLLKNTSTNMATIKATSHRAFGNMTGSLSCSLSMSTTLASSTLGGSTPTILQRFSRNTTNVPLTGMETNTLA
jgi:hypothetical protein